MARSSDFVVIGGGMAGASAAYELQARGSVRLIEAEPRPGAHTTGRSAAFLVESYGTPVLQRLTRATRPLLASPEPGFADAPILEPRPTLFIARADQRQRLADDGKLAREAGVAVDELGPEDAERLCPVLRPGVVAAALLEPGAQSIDVGVLLSAFLGGFRARGGELVTGRPVTGLSRGAGADGAWQVRCGDECYEAPVVVNAAGAWGDPVARLAGVRPVGLEPLRRTVATFDAPRGVDPSDWPCVIDAEEEFYLKPDGKGLLASPCDETPSVPCDARPDAQDVALLAERLARATTLELGVPKRCWAGLRSFVADRVPVVGFDAEQPGFFWLVGQGGHGIMTSAAVARAVAGLVVDAELPQELRALGVREGDLSPERSGLRRG